jgi:hypothetical protein
MKRFVCSRQVECLVEVEAVSIQDALARLPSTPDELVETADGIAFGTDWAIQIEGIAGRPQSFDDGDVLDAKKDLPMPGRD